MRSAVGLGGGGRGLPVTSLQLAVDGATGAERVKPYGRDGDYSWPVGRVYTCVMVWFGGGAVTASAGSSRGRGSWLSLEQVHARRYTANFGAIC